MTDEQNESNSQKEFDKIPNRKIFEKPDEEFETALGKVLETTPEGITLISSITSVNPETNELEINQAIFADGSVRPAIIKLTKKMETGIDSATGKPISSNVCRAVVICCVPALSALLDHADGVKWIEDKLATEFSQINMRALRDTEDLNDSTLTDKMPTNLDDFINAKRSGGRIDNEAFNSLWSDLLKGFKSHNVVGKKVKESGLRKITLEKCLSNKAFAEAEYGNLEKVQLFKIFLMLLEKKGKVEGLDITIIKHWQDTRELQTYQVDDFDLGEVDFSGMLEG